ncbi:MAG: acylphosphatase [Candidatus Dormiibacterota bacterium]
MGEAMVRVRAVVHGRVQMVGFRAFVIHHAGDAGLSGTVRNEPDGTVETVLEGPRAAVERVLELLRQGPSHARVERIDVEYSDPTGNLPAMMVAS